MLAPARLGAQPLRPGAAHCLFECGAAGAWPLLGANSAFAGLSPQGIWDSFQERMICDQQTRAPRLAPVPIMMPLPPAPDSTSIFKIQTSGQARSAFADPAERPRVAAAT